MTAEEQRGGGAGSGRRGRNRDRERGMVTAEYAAGMVATCGFGAVLYRVLTSDGVVGMLAKLVGRALEFAL